MNPELAAPTRDEVMADTQETLRAVARALDALGPVEPSPAVLAEASMAAVNPLHRLARFLSESYGELAEILEGLRETRGLFRKAEMHRLQHTHQTLQEVTSQTEMATTGMLDGLERCLALVDQLEGPSWGSGSGTAVVPPSTDPGEVGRASGGTGPDAGADPRELLRDEIHQVMQHLQFQDITAQRIGHATGVLSDVEDRLLRLMGTLEQYGFAAAEEEERVIEAEVPVVCDPMATTQDADARQALADDIFA